MKNYFITNENQEQSGPFSEEVLIEAYKAGQYSAETHTWCEGMTDWKKLSSVMSDLGVQSPISTPPPFTAPVAAGPPAFVPPPTSMPPCPPPIVPPAPVQESGSPAMGFEQQLAAGSVPADSPISLYLVMPFKNIFNYKARSTRKEICIFTIFAVVILFAVMVIGGACELSVNSGTNLLGLTFLLLGIIWISLSIRRLNDISWNILWWAVPQFLGMIFFTFGSLTKDETGQIILLSCVEGNLQGSIIYSLICIIFFNVSTLILLLANFVDSKKEVNKFGPSPKYFNN